MKDLFPAAGKDGSVDNIRILIGINGKESCFHGTQDFPVEIYARHMVDNPDHKVDRHWHLEMQFTIVLAGQILFTVDRTEYVLETGDIIFVNSGVTHGMCSYHNNAEATYININFTSDVISSFPGSILEIKYVNPYVKNPAYSSYILRGKDPDNKKIVDQLEDICNIYKSLEPGYELEVFSALFSVWRKLIAKWNPSFIQTTALSSQRLKCILDYIHQNYSRPITLDEISQHVGLSSSGCCRLIKSSMRCTLFEYLMDYRLIQSTSLLKNTDLSIADIAFEVGFNSTSYFISNFKKKFDYTPKAFREIYQKNY